jgi:small GTP-binding protein
MKPADYIFKIVIGGAGGVGKTTLLHRYMTGLFKEDTQITIGVEFHTQQIEWGGKKVALSMWDLGGQDRFRFIQPSYVKGAVAGIIFFDMSNLYTINQVGEWVDLFRNNSSGSINILLGGTKIDSIDAATEESVMARAMEVVKQYNLNGFVPTSSKTGQGVTEIIQTLVGNLLSQIWRENELLVVTVSSH